MEVQGLSKSYGAVKAVQDVSFSVSPGTVHAILGQNGAGKSTLMRAILGLVRPDRGTVMIRGEVFRRKLLKHIGAVIERPDHYNYLSGADNLRILSGIGGKTLSQSDQNRLLELVSLKGREKDKVGGYSQGMKQRLGLAIALAQDPEILILDEPTNGLDPQGIADMRSLIIRLAKESGKSILLSSHLLHEVELMADSMLIMHQGKKIAEGKVSDLLHPEESLVELKFQNDERLIESIRESRVWSPFLKESDVDRLLFRMNPVHTPELVRWMVELGAQIRSVETRHSLEAFFLNLTQDASAAH